MSLTKPLPRCLVIKYKEEELAKKKKTFFQFHEKNFFSLSFFLLFLFLFLLKKQKQLQQIF
jgi:hypothetical protein